VLQKFAEILRENTRASDLSGRLGGDEFLLILTHVERENIEITLDRLREQFGSQIFTFNGQKVRVTASFGIAGFQGGEAPEINALVRQADKALYAAKRGGRNQVKVEPR
jgi:two-component system cell cycle response regulator